MRKKRQLWLSVFPVLIVLCSLWLCLPCLCADSSEAESEVEILPEVGSATAAAAINTNKIYRIQNIAANTSGRPSFLTDDNGAPSLRTQNSDRSQLWILTSVPGSTQYRLTPLSRTTLAYSGTDVGLYAYCEDECVVIDSMTNGSVYFSGTGWYIYPSGTNYYIYSSVTFSNDERILGRAGANASGVKLYYDEDVLDLEDWI